MQTRYSRKAVVAASVGLHARPAAVFVRAVNTTGLPITLARDGFDAVDARSLLEVMSGDFQAGVEVVVTVAPCSAADSEIRAAVDYLAGLLITDLADES